MAVITLSRQYGSGGNHIAGLVRQRLGYRFFDKHLMAQLGMESGLVSKKTLDQPEEAVRAASLLERFFATSWAPGGSDPAASTYGASAEGYKQLPPDVVHKLILLAYQQDNVILVGRGGQAALAGKPNVLHVRTVAPLDIRIPRVARWEGVSYDVAQKIIRERDKGAVDYVKQTYGVDANDATLYDVMINTGKITLEAAADLIVAALAALPVPA